MPRGRIDAMARASRSEGMGDILAFLDAAMGRGTLAMAMPSATTTTTKTMGRVDGDDDAR